MSGKLSYKARRVAQKLSRRKNISISLGGQTVEVDTSDFMPIIDHEYFQQLAGRKQLANAVKVYPDATHTRFHHSLDTLRRQRERNEFWFRYGMINAEDAKHLEVFALLHDLGHGPFSHALDRVCQISHDQNGAKKIETMKETIEKCDVSFERVRALFCENKKEDPLYLSVLHHPLGTDKFSYLYMDAYHCITARPDLGKLPQYVYWLDDELVVHAKCAMQAIELKRFYIMMYREVYLRKSCLIAQRILEKTIRALLRAGQLILTEDELWNLIDAELISYMRAIPETKKIYERYELRASKCVVALRLNGFARAENISEKFITVYEKNEETMATLIGHSSANELDELEGKLAGCLGIDPLEIDIVPAMGLHRYTPPPIMIVNGQETFLDTDLFPKNEEAIKEFARASIVFRICVSRELREKIHKKANLINDFFDEWLNSLQKSG